MTPVDTTLDDDLRELRLKMACWAASDVQGDIEARERFDVATAEITARLRSRITALELENATLRGTSNG